MFDGDNIKNDESKSKSHVLKLHGAHLSCINVNRYYMRYPSRQVPSSPGSFTTQHTDPPHGSGFLQLRRANQNQDKKSPHHVLLPACEESTKIIKQPQNLWLFSMPQHEIVLSLCRVWLVLCPRSLISKGCRERQVLGGVLGILTNNADPPILSELSMAMSRGQYENFCLLQWHHFSVKQVRKPVKQGHNEICFLPVAPNGSYFRSL